MRRLELAKDDISPVLKRSAIDYGGAFDAAQKIISAVKGKGDSALRELSVKFDRQSPKSFRVSEKDINAAYERTDKKTLSALKNAHKNIKRFHAKQYANSVLNWSLEISPGVFAGEKTSAIDSVGCYVPGGRAAYPSTVLMTVTPAKIAGVGRVVVVSPPPIPDVVLAAAKIAGADEIYSVGGAQAIAALAYGTKSIKPVSKIVGPGNKYVTAAKMLVYGTVDIDMPAGPSEILVIADETSNPEYIASDILAQAEHDPNAQCVMTCTDQRVIDSVYEHVRRGIASSDKRGIISESQKNIHLIKTISAKESIGFANMYCAEHLEVHTRNPESVAKKITCAGAIFIGPYSPVAAGDYASGGNHVLPTGGAARFSSQLSVRDYMKSTSVQRITKKGLLKLSKTIIALAEAEGLVEHSLSIRLRL